MSNGSPVVEQDEQDERIPLFIRAGKGAQAVNHDESFRIGEPTQSGPLPQPVSAPEAATGSQAALGNAYSDVPKQFSSGSSNAARDLGEFAVASDSAKPASGPATKLTEPPTHLSQVPPAQPPPQMPPGYAQTQEDLRNKSAVTPKYDPATGQTLDKYKVGLGTRIGRAFLDAGRGFLYGGLGGAIAAPLEGAFGNKNAPGYYGKGAVSGQYAKDEQARQQAVAADTAKIGSWEAQQKEAQQTWKDTEEVRKDTTRQAYQQDTTEERARHQQEEEDLKQQAETLKEQLREIKYDPQSKQFMHNDTVYTPKNVEEGAVLEVQHGIQNGPYRQMWEKERRNQPIIHTGGDKGFNARDLVRIKSYAKDHNIKLKSTSPDDIADSMTQQQVDEALSNKYVDAGDSLLRGDALKNFKADTDVQNVDAEMKKLEGDRALYTAGLGSDDPNLKKQSQDALKGIDQRISDLTARRNTARDRYVQQQNKREESNRPGATNPPAVPVTGKAAPVQTSGNQPKLTPIPDKSYKSPKGKVYNIGDDVAGHGKIKGFGKTPDGQIHAMF